ncbi:MAG: hypothetical protein ACU843_10615 [Gammaproteobacteria bacterium]
MSTTSSKGESLLISLPIAFFLLVLQGCAVLTDSQIDAVASFARAAQNYGTLPGTVIQSHAQIFLTEKTLIGAGLNDPELAVKKINGGVNEYRMLLTTAAEADSALSVLDIYVAMLKRLSSDEFTDQLEMETVELGSQLDRAIAERNKHSTNQIDSFGAVVAAIVRGGGGIYIRHRQAEALKKAVTEADPMIEEMQKPVVELMDVFIQEAPNNEEDLRTAYQDLLRENRISHPLGDSEKFARLLFQAKGLVPLAKMSKQAIISFRKAHKSLYDKLQEPRDLSGTIEEIQVLSNEIQAARRLKKQIGG